MLNRIGYKDVLNKLPHLPEVELQKLANELYKTGLVGISMYRRSKEDDKIILSDKQIVIAYADCTIVTDIIYLVIRPKGGA